MDEPTVIGMIYSDIQDLKKDMAIIKEWRWKMMGVGAVISFVATVLFQITIALMQK